MNKQEGKETDKVRIEYWMSPSVLSSYSFLKSFKSLLYNFNEYVIFTPKYKFKNLSGIMPLDFLQKNCFDHGQFCATDNETFESQSVLMEGIRQICIWNTSFEQNNRYKLWWDYIVNYADCLESKAKHTFTTSQHCYEIIYDQIDVPEDIANAIKKCVDSSFLIPENKYLSSNSILQSNSNNSVYQNVYLVPAVFLNDNLVKEDLKPKLIVSAICEKLITKPAICSTYLDSEINWDYQSKENDYSSFSFFLVIFAFAVIIMFLILTVIKRNMSGQISTEINSEIRSHVTEYMKLRDSTASD